MLQATHPAELSVGDWSAGALSMPDMSVPQSANGGSSGSALHLDEVVVHHGIAVVLHHM